MVDSIAVRCFHRIADGLRSRIGDDRYDTWFKSVSLVEFKRGCMTIGVPNRFFRDWIINSYLKDLETVAGNVVGSAVTFDVIIDEDLARLHMADVESRRLAEELDQPTPKGAQAGDWASFVARPENAVAHGVVCEWIDGVDDAAGDGNLVIIGPSGTGKTHLLNCLATAWRDRRGASAVRQTDALTFTKSFSLAIKARDTQSFRRRFENIELLCVDEVHRLKGKKATQVEFKHLLTRLAAHGTRVAMAARYHPREMHDVADVLQSILLSGMLVRTEPYSAASLVEIARKSRPRGSAIASSEVVRRLARGARGSVTELERRLSAARTLSAVTGEILDAGFLRRHERELGIGAGAPESPTDGLIDAICSHFGVDRHDFVSKRKLRSLMVPRALLVWVLRERGRLTFREIGRILGGRSHTSAHLIHQNHRRIIEDDVELSALARRLPASDPLSSDEAS